MRSGIILIGIILSLLTGGKCFIIPDEVPSLLSLIYSNIPPVKKGTDSRVGFGFRLGPHVDFQVLLELGPQTNTDPIGGAEGEPPAKRDALVLNNPYALMDYFKNLQGGTTTEENTTKNPEKKLKKEKVSNTDGGKWIKWWKKNILGSHPIGKIKFNKVPGVDDLKTEASENILDLREMDTSRRKFIGYLRRLYRRRERLLE